MVDLFGATGGAVEVTAENFKDGLRQRGFMLPGFALEAYFGLYGEVFQSAPYDGKGMTKKMCFSNAQSLVKRRKGLAYAEGLAISTIGLTTLHGWAVEQSTGKVVDPTWDDPELCLYCGIIVPVPSLRGCQFDTGIGLNMDLMLALHPEFQQDYIDKLPDIQARWDNLTKTVFNREEKT